VLWLLRILLFISLLAIAWQDFRSRMISLWLIIIFFLLNSAVFLFQNSLNDYFKNAAFCIAYMLVSYVFIRLYYLAGGRGKERILDEKVGWGDVVIFLIMGFSLEPFELIFFYTFTFIFSLVLYLLFMSKKRPVPLAAFVSLIYLLKSAVEILFPDYKISNYFF
jgi:hypothetical protein